jgi:FlaA1/EpsC-like NDP-sugar epimerase
MDKKQFISGKNVLVTGGTGTVAYGLINELLKYGPHSIRILSNDENGLFEFRSRFKDHPELRYLIGDVRDFKRLDKSMTDVQLVFHTAALKHVWLCEYNPTEAIQTNIFGIMNIIDATIKHEVEHVVFTSSDKAVNPSNVMGTTKLLGEKLITSANFAKGKAKTKFSSVRFGNILGSRGSVVPIFEQQIRCGEQVSITDKEMSRFVLTLQNAVELILDSAMMSVGGETFILKMDIINVLDLYEAMVDLLVPKEQMAKGRPKPKIIGRQPGEKLYEELMTIEELPRTFALPKMFVVIPDLYKDYQFLDYSKYSKYPRCKKVYRSDTQKALSRTGIKKLLNSGNIFDGLE